MEVRAESLTGGAPVTFNRAQTFRTNRRPVQSPLATESRTVIHGWFKDSQISVGVLDDDQQVSGKVTIYVCTYLERYFYRWHAKRAGID